MKTPGFYYSKGSCSLFLVHPSGWVEYYSHALGRWTTSYMPENWNRKEDDDALLIESY